MVQMPFSVQTVFDYCQQSHHMCLLSINAGVQNALQFVAGQHREPRQSPRSVKGPNVSSNDLSLE